LDNEQKQWTVLSGERYCCIWASPYNASTSYHSSHPTWSHLNWTEQSPLFTTKMELTDRIQFSSVQMRSSDEVCSAVSEWRHLFPVRVTHLVCRRMWIEEDSVLVEAVLCSRMTSFNLDLISFVVTPAEAQNFRQFSTPCNCNTVEQGLPKKSFSRICVSITPITKSIWKTLGPFATTSRLTPIHQMSLAVLSRAACPRQRRRRQRQRVTEGTAMAPWNGPNEAILVPARIAFHADFATGAQPCTVCNLYC